MRTVERRAPNAVLTEVVVDVPLDHGRPDGERIDVFARAVEPAVPERAELPWLVFLQGGPGFEAPRPTRGHDPVWLRRALRDYRVLMLDQRGTGRSSPVGPGDADGRTPEELADRLALFRADSIVRDAELVRQAMGVERWSVLGQSFGGFCAVTYLSLFPGSLREAYLTGGLPPLDRHVDDVYTATYRRTADKVAAHYARYPEDRERVLEVVERLDAEQVRLPDGDPLTPRRLRMLGHLLGTGDGSEHLHYILEQPFGSPGFLHDVHGAVGFARNPLYAVVHEACYAPSQRTAWSAERVRPADHAADPAMLTGEHIYPWMFEDFGALRPFAAAAELLAQRDWGPLYDPEALGHNAVPAAAAVYAEDMYVEREYSEESARRISGLRMWLTNEYEHDGIRAGNEHVLDRLIALARGRA